MRTGFYPGSFDPVTNGHSDIIRRGATLVDKLVIGIGVHHGKKPLFSVDEKTVMLEAELRNIGKHINTKFEITTFDGLVVDAAKHHKAEFLLRGLRNSEDLAYEMQMSGMNGEMMPDVQTVFLPASPGVQHIASSLVRQIASMGGNVQPFVPGHVADMLKAKFAG